MPRLFSLHRRSNVWLLLAALFVGISLAGKIDHVVVLMLENRSFDHMCGWLNKKNPKINGLTGKEFNVANGTTYYVADTCPYINPFDPHHAFDQTTMQLMSNFTGWIYPAPMSGFAQDHFLSHYPEFWTVMHGFSPERVPSISTLAEEFTVFDAWFSSLPGPTVPNRLFFHSGTSLGHTGQDDDQIAEGYPQKTLFDVLNDNHITWSAYYQDISDLLYLRNPRAPENIVNIKPFDQFKKDASEGNLPTYTWLSPQFFPSATTPAKDQHPDHDVVDGEQLIAEVYAQLRNGPKWNNTLFMVTYDEHGGFYDHVPPPQGAPNPDGRNDVKNGFNFTRVGIRVCTIVASPYVPKGGVVSYPSEAGKHYEHTSIFNTLKNLFPMSDDAELTNRTAWAPPFDHVLSLTEPRTDCPTSLPTPSNGGAQQAAAILAEQQRRAPNGLQKELYTMIENVFGRSGADHARFKTQQEMGDYVHKRMEDARHGLHLQK